MPDAPVTLATIETYLNDRNGRRSSLSFPPALENLYAEQMKSYRLKVMERGILPAVVVYNLFLIADYLLLPETFFLSASVHLFIVTPLVLLVGLLYPRIEKQWAREAAATIIPIAMVAQIMFIYLLNRWVTIDHLRGDAADHYQYLAIMVMIYMNVNQRFGFRLAVVSTLALTAVYLGALLSVESTFDTKFIGIAMMVSGGYLSLIANHRMEQDVRFNFLRGLKDRLLREDAEEVSLRDALTGLANRRELDRRAEALWRKAEASSASVAVVMIDIDYFKPFNDRYGHVAGDNCLKRVAAAIASQLRNDDDLAVRFGGEEFLVLLPRTDLSDAVRVAERVRRQVENLAIPNEANHAKGIVTASLGVTSGPTTLHSFEELLASADGALYAAKRNGRNQVWPPFVSKSGDVTPIGPVFKTTGSTRSG